MSINKNPTCRVATIENDFIEWLYSYRRADNRACFDQIDMQEAFIEGYKLSRKDFAELREKLNRLEAEK
jgi:hypothetical protein